MVLFGRELGRVRTVLTDFKYLSTVLAEHQLSLSYAGLGRSHIMVVLHFSLLFISPVLMLRTNFDVGHLKRL